jgi:hypothetical protein
VFKRATWLGVGFTLGVGTTVVAARKARQQLDRYKPPAVVDRVTTSITDKASSLRAHVTEALADGRDAARAREQELRAEAPTPRGASTPDPGVTANRKRTREEDGYDLSRVPPANRR